MKISQLILDLLEYALIFVFIYLFWVGKLDVHSGKSLIVFIAIALYFLASGSAWLMREETGLLKEYLKYKIWMEVIAFIIGILTLIYVMW